VIIDKLWRLGAASRAAREHEARAASARSPQELTATEGRDPAGLVISAGLAESTAEPRPHPETAGERRERIERAMRLTLNAELRRLELRLPFPATLGSAAPFIGLFGTVWGIMRSFEGIATANSTSLAVVAPGDCRGLVRHCDGPRRGDPGGRRLQQHHGRSRPLCRAHAGADRAIGRPARASRGGLRMAVALPPSGETGEDRYARSPRST
jgi:hypothetical protein